MRVIGGKYGGRKLVAFKASHIRPTTDRVKETLFNKLQFSIEEASVLDLFSGTGSLAIECLSRGAQSVEAVESSAKSVAIIEKNKKLLEIGPELDILTMDVFRYLKKVDRSFEIILIDPPFTKKIASEVLEALSTSCAPQEGTRVFIESTSKEKVEESYGSLRQKSHKSYGDKYLSEYIFG